MDWVSKGEVVLKFTTVQSNENRFAMLFEDEEEEVKTTKKEVAKTGKGPRVNEKRWVSWWNGVMYSTGGRPPKREFDRHSGTGRG